jgi:pilus assembly protein CpaB
MKARAVAIEVAEKNSVNQWIRPNDHVDVIGLVRDPNTREQVAITLMQNIIVLATGHYSGMSVLQSDEDKRYQHVVLLTLPAEAEILALAANSGELTLTLRNPKDLDTGDGEKREKTDGTTLMSGERTEALRQARARSFQQVDIIRGTARNKEFKEGGPAEAAGGQ